MTEQQAAEIIKVLYAISHNILIIYLPLGGLFILNLIRLVLMTVQRRKETCDD